MRLTRGYEEHGIQMRLMAWQVLYCAMRERDERDVSACIRKHHILAQTQPYPMPSSRPAVSSIGIVSLFARRANCSLP